LKNKDISYSNLCKNMKKYLATLILFCLVCTSALAQQRKSGKLVKSKSPAKSNARTKVSKKSVAYKSTSSSGKRKTSSTSKSKKRNSYARKSGNSKRNISRYSKIGRKSYAAHQATQAGQFLGVSKATVAMLSPEDRVYANGLILNRGKLPWPVEGEISIPYGDYTIEGTRVKGRNPGITIATTEKDMPVKAVSDGVVSRVDDEGEVATVFIRHGNYCTVYSNLSSIEVEKGAIVKSGDRIGTVGEAYAASGGELNFLLMKERDNLNPAPWFGAN
jgi:murein hydrolase activator